MTLEEFGLRLLLFAVPLGVRLCTDLSVQGLLHDVDFPGLQFGFPLGFCNVCIGRRNLDGFALLLLLNGIGGVRFRFLYVRLLLEFRLTDGKRGLLFRDFHFGLDFCVVRFLGGLCLCNCDIPFRLRFCNRRALFNLRNVVDTQVFNHIVLVGERLDVERDHFKAHLAEIGNRIFLYALAESLAVGDHFLQPHLAHDFTHIALQRILNPADNHILVFVQEELGGKRHHLGTLADADLDRSVHLYIDVLRVRNEIGRLYIDGEHFQGQLIQPLQKRNANPRFADQDARLPKTRDQKSRVRRRFYIPNADDNNNHKQRR